MGATNEKYIFDQQSEQERERLVALSALFDAKTTRHLSAAGVTAGWHCLEIGAGAGSVARWLGETVGRTGRVLATDLDLRFLTDLGPAVEVVRHDVATDPIDEAVFDLVHARAVTEHLADRLGTVTKLARSLRPGGVLLLEDAVFGGPATRNWERATCPPFVAGALTRVMEAVATGFRAIGADPEYGLELPATLRAAGLVDVEGELTYRLVRGGTPEAAFFELTLTQLSDRLIAAGLLNPEDAQAFAPSVKDPEAYWLSIGMASAWGRAPG